MIPNPTALTGGPSVPDCRLYDSAGERKIAVLTVDFSDLSLNPVAGFIAAATPAVIDFPEFASNAANASAVPFIGYQIVELDLATLVNGIGLEEVRSVLIYSRPSFGFTAAGDGPSDFAQTNVDLLTSPLLTNVRTMQTVTMNQSANQLNESSDGTYRAAEECAKPFFGMGSSIPIRILNFVGSVDGSGNPQAFGKYTFLFLNWDAAAYSTVALMLG